MHNEFLREFYLILDKLEKESEDIPIEKLSEIFYELATTEKMKEKLVLFAVCMSSITKTVGEHGF